MLGEQFMVGDEICGAVVSIRFAVKIKFFIFVFIFDFILSHLSSGGYYISVEPHCERPGNY